jgi:putative DNA primase/helicase
MRAAALGYAQCYGWRVFPVRPGDKKPLITEWQNLATDDPSTIKDWWTRWPEANIGLACGLSGLVAIDLDVKGGHNGLEVWNALKAKFDINDDTVVSLTPSGGQHLLFSSDGTTVRNSASKVGPGIDVRGEGGYVVLPPSMLADGGGYAWLIAPTKRGPAALPAQVAAMLAEEARPTQPPPQAGAVTNAEPYARAALERECDELARTLEGKRNDQLNRAAFNLGQLVGAGTLGRGTVEAELERVALSIGLEPGEVRTTIESGLEAGIREPRIAPPTSRLEAATGELRPPESGTVEGRAHNASAKAQPTEGYALTDLGNAERLVKRHGEDLHYCFARNEWLIWDGCRWVADRSGEVERRAKATVRAIYGEAAGVEDEGKRRAIVSHALKSESNSRLKAMIDLAKSEPGIPVLPGQLDADPWLFNCRNCAIDLRTGSMLAHRREDLITKLAPVDYDPDAALKLWDEFLRQVTSPGVAAFLQRAVGYSLTGDTSQEVLFFIHGPANSGKTTFIEAIKATLGDYAATADFETFLKRRDVGGPRPDIARLAGARLVASVEVDKGKELAEGLIKQLTGGDTFTARFLYSKEFEFAPAFKLWLAANDAPKMSPSDGAFWRRILRIPFEKTIPAGKRDPSVKATLRNPSIAGPAILAWAVRGCLEWQRQGLMTCPEVEQATDELRAQMDPLKEFVEECCILHAEAWTDAATLRQTYEAWAKERGEHPVYGKAWGEGLHMRGCVQKNRWLQDKSVRGWQGIGLTSPSGEPPQGAEAPSLDALTDLDAGIPKSSLVTTHVEDSPNDPSRPVKVSRGEREEFVI